MKRTFHIISGLLLACFLPESLPAQRVKNGSCQTVVHIKSDGIVQDSSYRAIVHADGIPMKWAAFSFSSI